MKLERQEWSLARYWGRQRRWVSTKNRETKPIVSVVVVAVGPGRAVVAAEEGGGCSPEGLLPGGRWYWYCLVAKKERVA